MDAVTLLGIHAIQHDEQVWFHAESTKRVLKSVHSFFLSIRYRSSVQMEERELGCGRTQHRQEET